MKKIVLFLISIATSVSLFALDVTKEVEVSPHLQLVKFENNLSFIMGEGSSLITTERTLKPFAMNKYETTYGLWYDVRVKAEKIGYSFYKKGQAGTYGKIGSEPDDVERSLPVSTISWHDAIVWCNAYSELQGREPCYTYKGEVLRDSNDTAKCDLSECNWNANGFRLPSEAEWEYAARRNKDSFTKGDVVSGVLDKDKDDPLLFAWTYENANQLRVVGTAGIPFDVSENVKKGSGNANLSGLFDMSGNVMEYCWDWYGEEYKEDQPYGPDFGDGRVSRGGSYTPYTFFVNAGDRYHYDPNEFYAYNGFRICCSLID